MNNSGQVLGIDGLKDKSYLARCQKTLRSWGAPLSGWTCKEIYDIRDDDRDAPLHVCELCGCTKVRYVHVMTHPDYFEDVSVGCICAGIMEGDILAAKNRERLMRNRSKRKRSFPRRKWTRTANGWSLTYHGDQILIGHSRHNPERLGVKYNGQCVWTYKGKPITDFLSAAYAAFNLADPAPEVARVRDRMLSEDEGVPTQDLRR
jgi:hypothetical protein